ncbi:hypothetical protein [Amycolatopsis sp. NBC_01286]|uniref:hypothetical protein n=1 Tax=Amycolatopsis sp. NBC_01286 TaxID=2903560 RepID=UPI002E11E9B4|nr:hypothetical protein OG570_28745 [Amycolatopsis sp. NBC_01286]
MSDPTPDKELSKVVGSEVAAGLTRWARSNGMEIILPANGWTARGFTDAFVTSLIVRDPDNGDFSLALKVAGEHARSERETHEKALMEAPEEFRANHLVELEHGVIELDGGRIGYFQSLAGGSSRVRPVADLSSAAQHKAAVATCIAASDGLTNKWNTAPFVTRKSTVREFLRREVGHLSGGGTLGSLGRWAASTGWGDLNGRPLRVTGEAVRERVLPDPLLLLGEHPLGACEITVHTGYSHGDLHLGNLLVPTDDRGTRPERYRLIDLSTYQSAGPRSRDLAALLTSGLALLWPGLGPTYQEFLLDDVANFDGEVPERQDKPVLDLIRGVPGVMTAEATRRGFEHEWRVEFTLALLAAALRSTTHENLDPELRWWFVQLAGRLTARYLEIEGVAMSQKPPVEFSNPFPGHRPSPTTAASTTSRPDEVPRLRGLLLGGMSTRDADR